MFKNLIKMGRDNESGKVKPIPKKTRLDSSREYGKMGIDKVLAVLATKQDPEKFYLKLKNIGCIVDPEAVEGVLKEMGYDL